MNPSVGEEQATRNLAPPSAPVPLRPPFIPDHELLRRIGTGAYGDVWLARNVFGEARAVKIVHRARFREDAPYERELRGIRHFEPVSRSHDGFVHLLQAGRDDRAGYFYYVMELADNVSPDHVGDYHPLTLRSAIERRGRLSAEECVRLGIDLSRALAALHALGLLHRDIKPSNIIFVRGGAKLADIGLVVEQSEARSYVGTEGFVPPEGPNSAQADIYALGKVLYEAAMGKRQCDFPEPLSEIDALPEGRTLLELNAVILGCCALDPARRYASADALRSDLELIGRGGSAQHRLANHQRWRALAERAGAGGISAVIVLAIAAVLSRTPNQVTAPEFAQERFQQQSSSAFHRLLMEFGNGEGVAAVALARLYDEARKTAAHARPSMPTLYNESVLADQPVLYFTFDQPEGTVLHNHSSLGASLDGFLTHHASPDFRPQLGNASASPVLGSSLGLFNYEDVVVIRPHASLRLINDFTLEFWLFWDGSGTGQLLVNRGWNVNGIGLRVTESGQLDLRFCRSEPGLLARALGPTLPAKTWSYVAVCFSRENEARFFLDGSLAVTVSVGLPARPADGPFFIGGDWLPRNEIRDFPGSIDELAVYTRELPPQRFAERYRLARNY